MTDLMRALRLVPGDVVLWPESGEAVTLTDVRYERDGTTTLIAGELRRCVDGERTWLTVVRRAA